MIERTIDIATRDGKTTTFIVHPERGGPHPVIFFYMDAPAIREELRDMAQAFRHRRILRRPAQPLLPQGRDGARSAARPIRNRRCANR